MLAGFAETGVERLPALCLMPGLGRTVLLGATRRKDWGSIWTLRQKLESWWCDYFLPGQGTAAGREGVDVGPRRGRIRASDTLVVSSPCSYQGDQFQRAPSGEEKRSQKGSPEPQVCLTGGRVHETVLYSPLVVLTWLGWHLWFWHTMPLPPGSSCRLCSAARMADQASFKTPRCQAESWAGVVVLFRP